MEDESLSVLAHARELCHLTSIEGNLVVCLLSRGLERQPAAVSDEERAHVCHV